MDGSGDARRLRSRRSWLARGRDQRGNRLAFVQDHRKPPQQDIFVLAQSECQIAKFDRRYRPVGVVVGGCAHGCFPGTGVAGASGPTTGALGVAAFCAAALGQPACVDGLMVVNGTPYQCAKPHPTYTLPDIDRLRRAEWRLLDSDAWTPWQQKMLIEARVRTDIAPGVSPEALEAKAKEGK